MNTNKQDINSLEFLEQRAQLKEGAEGRSNIFMAKKREGWKKQIAIRNKLQMQRALYANRLGTVIDVI